MAMPATMVYEFRTTASNNNGGGFKDGGTGTDHSLQGAAEYNDTDLVIDGADDTKVTSATHNFVATDVDNVINITAGVGFTPGRYHITAAAANAATLDRACGATGSTGGTYYVGGALALPTDAILETFVPGNKAWMEAGTYTLTGAIAVGIDGTAALPIIVEGYNSSRGDEPTGNDQPLIAAAANTFEFDDYWFFYHIRCTIATTNGWRSDLGGRWINCKSQNTTGFAFYSYYQGFLHDCEIISDAGNGIYARVGTHFQFCYIHDCGARGIFIVGSGVGSIVSCIIDSNVTNGIDLGSNNSILIMNNTIYNNGVGIAGTDGELHFVFNNLIDSNTTGASWTSEMKSNIFDYNNWNGNGTDVSKVTKGDNATANVPGFAGAAGGDFSDVDAANGFGIRLGVG